MNVHTNITAAEALKKKANSGFECPQCGCRDLIVYKSIPGEQERGRRRKCRNCGARIGTIEVVVSDK